MDNVLSNLIITNSGGVITVRRLESRLLPNRLLVLWTAEVQSNSRLSPCPAEGIRGDVYPVLAHWATVYRRSAAEYLSTLRGWTLPSSSARQGDR